MSRSTAKHSRWWTGIASFGIWMGIQLVCMTLRLKNIREVSDELYRIKLITCLWHNRNFVCPYAWSQMWHSHPMGAFTSASKDGALLAGVVRFFGMKSIRGSSHRRGATAFLEARQSILDGSCMAITPDGPKGPIYKVQPGIIKLASMTGVPIVPVCVEYENCWRLGKAWDRYCIPKPFSKVTIMWKKPFHVPAALDEESLVDYVNKLEMMMKTGKPDFENLPV